MLSYRHSFHAGNFADILKHYVLFKVLNYFNRKDSPYLYLDTHGGAGFYDLSGDFALKNKEFESGYQKLVNAEHLPDDLSEFKDFLKYSTIEKDTYPGSSIIAAQLLRKNDTLQSCELHTSDFQLLRENLLEVRKKHSFVFQEDGYQRLLGQLPPPQKRGAVLIDPSYEDKQDYQKVIKTLKKALKLFPQGTYMVWYPLLNRSELPEFLQNLYDIRPENFLDIQIILDKIHEGYGMYGCGMYIVNPPYNLPQQLRNIQSDLLSLLGNSSSDLVIESHIS